MRKLPLFCFFVLLLPLLGCVGTINAEQFLMANLSDVTAQISEDELGTVVFTLLESITGAEVDTVVDSEGFGVIRYGFGYEPTALERAQSSLPAGFLDSLNCSTATSLLLENAPDGATLVEEKRGSAIWCVINVPFSNLLQLAELYETIFAPATYANALEKPTARDYLAPPMVKLTCLEMVDGLFYQQLALDEAALQPDDADLLDVFGIDLKWRITMPGDIRSHNAPAKLTFPLVWDLLDAPEMLNVNMQPTDACPSSRIKLLLEFTATDVTLATLTIPISRNADDHAQNEAVRQQLAESGWLTQIEGSANHAPRIVAIRQFEQAELGQILTAIPGVQGVAQVVRQISPQDGAATEDSSETNARASDSSATNSAALAATELPTNIRINLNLEQFSNTWAILMPTNVPVAFELDIDSMRQVESLSGEWTNASHPTFLWHESDEAANRELLLQLSTEQDLPMVASSEPEPISKPAESADTESSNVSQTDESAPESTAQDDVVRTEDGSSADGDDTNVMAQISNGENSAGPTLSVGTPMTAEKMQPLSVREVQTASEATPSEAEGEITESSDALTVVDVENSQGITTSVGTLETEIAEDEPAEDVAQGSGTSESVSAPSTTKKSSTLTVAALVRSASAATQTPEETSEEIDTQDEELDGERDEELEIDQSADSEATEANSNPTVGDLLQPEAGESGEDESTSSSAESIQPAPAQVDAEATEADLTLTEQSDAEEDVKTLADLLGDEQDTADANQTEGLQADADDVLPSTTPDADAEPAEVEVATTVENVAPSGPLCTVFIEWLNLRPGPGREYGEPTQQMPSGTELLVVAKDQYETWIEVIAQDSSERGWVNPVPEFVTCPAGALADVPVVDLANFQVSPAPVSSGSSTDTNQSTPAVNPLSQK